MDAETDSNFVDAREAFCRALDVATQLPIYAGPPEAPVLGNLGMQFLAAGDIESLDEMYKIIARSADVRTYLP